MGIPYFKYGNIDIYMYYSGGKHSLIGAYAWIESKQNKKQNEREREKEQKEQKTIKQL